MKIGDIVQKVALARWSRTLSALVAAGVPLLPASTSRPRRPATTSSRRRWPTSSSPSSAAARSPSPLRDASVFPGMVAQMVAVGEETGALDTMLSKIADFYEDQVDASVKSLTSILEPIMLVVVGGIVGFIVISMYLPLFKVYDQIK